MVIRHPSPSLSLFALLAVFMISSAPAAERTAERYVVSRWGMEDGLPQSSVNDILQTRDGYIWFSTHGGLVRFDGTAFTTFDRNNTPGMRSDRLLGLFEASDGALWLSSEDGFMEFRDGRCTPYLIVHDGLVYSPSMVAQDARGVMWLSVNGVPYRRVGDRFERQNVRTDTALARRATDDPGGIWLMHDFDLLRTVGDTIVRVADLRGRLSSTVREGVEHPAGSGVVYMATNGDGVARYEEGRLTLYSESEGLTSRFALRVIPDRGGGLWTVCYNGIARWNGDGFTPFDEVPANGQDQITSIMKDGEGNYWIGTPNRGLYRVRPSPLWTIGSADGLKNTKMLSLTRRRDGTFLFATNCGGVYEWSGGRAVPSAVNAFLPNLCVWSVFEDSKGRFWFGAQVLYRTSSLTSPGRMFDSTDGFTGRDVFAVTEDSRGIIWIGCLNGLFRYDGERFRRYSTADGLSYNDVRTIVEDASGALWIGTSGGLNVLRNGKIAPLDLLDGQTAPGRTTQPYIRAILPDADGTLWLGSYGDGLIRYKDGKAFFITAQDGLFDNIVSHIVEDPQGFLWMGSNRGLFRNRKRRLHEFCDGMTDRVRSYSYGTADGMRSAETNGGFQPSIVRDESGRLFVPTVEGVTVVSTWDVTMNTVPPPVFIEAAVNGGLHDPAPDTLVMPHDSAFLEIRYTALSYTDPHKVRFRYRLEGLDERWTEAGPRRSAFYTQIPPGEYRFRVIACNNDGVWNEIGASMAIIVMPPFWMTWWFRALIGLAFLVAGPSAYFLRIAQLKRDKVRQEQFSRRLIESQERERRRIAAELHDGIGQQILVIKNRAELALRDGRDPERLREELREIAGSALSSINDIRAISHDLRPVHLEDFGLTETLRVLGEQLQAGSAVDWIVDIDDIDGVLPAGEEINFFRILQEGSKNILTHSGASHASLIVRREEETVTATLWDDGRGFDADAPRARPGMGLRGMEERVHALGGTLTLRSHPGDGTTVTVTVPIMRT